MTSKLMKATKEALNIEQTQANLELSSLDNQEQGEALFQEEAKLDFASEVIYDRFLSLESIVESLKNLSDSEVTPVLAAVVQSSIRLPDEPTIAMERDNSEAEDIVFKDKDTAASLKSRAGQALETMKKVLTNVLKAVIDFMRNVYDWIVQSRTRALKTLEEQKSKIFDATKTVDIKLTRAMQPLVYKEDFSVNSAETCLVKYSSLVASSAYAVRDVIIFTNMLKSPSFIIGKVVKFKEHFIKATENTIDWSSNNGTVFNGEGGVDLTINFNKYSLHIEPTSSDYDVTTSTSTFTKSDVTKVNKLAINMLKGTSECEIELKEMRNTLLLLTGQATLYSLVTNDLLTLDGTRYPVVNIIVDIRRVLSFASKVAVASTLKAAYAAISLGNAYIKGQGITNEDETDTSNVMHKQLAYNA